MEQVHSGLTIDWRLLLEQIGNFLIIFGVLTWLVWRPLIKMIDDRRRTIDEGLAAAAAQKKAFAEAEAAQARILAEARSQASQLLAQAREQLKQERDQAKKALAEERVKLTRANEKDLAAARRKLEDDLRRTTADLIVKALSRIFETQKEEPTEWLPLVTKAIKELE